MTRDGDGLGSNERAFGVQTHFLLGFGEVGHADFRDLRSIIPNASSSTGSAALLAELDATFR